MFLAGRVTLCSPDHVSLLVHRTFNVSIPRHHIPTDHWEFEYGPAENDPEFGNIDDDMDVDAMADVQGDDAQATTDQRGRWVHKITGDRLGGKDRSLGFTVVGLTVANQMLSLVGSIQPDPFSPEHVPQVKPDQVQSPRPPPGSLSEPIESEGTEDGKDDSLATRGEKKREKDVEKHAKRKRKQDNAVAKSDRKPKRKKTS